MSERYFDESGNAYVATGERRVPEWGEWFTSSMHGGQAVQAEDGMVSPWTILRPERRLWTAYDGHDLDLDHTRRMTDDEAAEANRRHRTDGSAAA